METAIPAFVGYTEIDPGEVRKIKSMVEFEQVFGGPRQTVTVTYSATEGTVTTTSIDSINVASLGDYLYYAMLMFYANGGGDCYVCSAGTYGTAAVADFTDTTSSGPGALQKIEKEDEPTMIVMPDAVSLGTTEFGTTVAAALAQCGTLKDRFAIIDTQGTTSITSDSSAVRTAVGTQNLRYGGVYYPWLNTGLRYPDSAIKMAEGSLSTGDPAILTHLDGLTLAQVKDVVAGDFSVVNANNGTDLSAADQTLLRKETSNLLNLELQGINDTIAENTIQLPPSSSIAGVYATVDRTRGVWKAPANISLNNVASLPVTITDDDQADMNVDTDGKSINAIRFFTGKGTLVWGARTLAGNNNEWRYVPVRRLYIMAEESIKKATEFVVFEPNDANTWTRTRAMIENFLNLLWRQGALAGSTPEQAYFVNVGLGETMTPQDILEGRLIIEIGMAAVRPAEFIILRFSHKLQES